MFAFLTGRKAIILAAAFMFFLMEIMMDEQPGNRLLILLIIIANSVHCLQCLQMKQAAMKQLRHKELTRHLHLSVILYE